AGRVPEALSGLAGAENKNKPLVVGYYRTEADNLRLQDRDLSLAQALFPQPYHVFLLIQPNVYDPPSASFFFHESDGKMAEFSFMEFPFEASVLAGEDRDRVKRSLEAARKPSTAIAPARAGRRPGMLRTLLAVITLVVFIGGITAGSRAFPSWWSRIRAVRLE